MVRQATSNDRHAIQKLYQQLCPTQPINVLASRIAEIENDDDMHLLVYEHDGEVVGTLFLAIFPDPMSGRQPIAIIENVVVDEAHRESGVAMALMRRAEEVVRYRHATKIISISRASRHEAHSLYREAGYSADGVVGFKKFMWGTKLAGDK